MSITSPMAMLSLVALVVSILSIVPTALCDPANFSAYANDFVNPNTILAKDFNTSTAGSQQTIVAWADFLAAQGPWSVMNKSVIPPTGNKHDYLSWAP